MRAGIVLCFLLLFGCGVEARPQVPTTNVDHDEQKVFYSFTGSTLPEIRRNMFASSPNREGGQTFTGYAWSNWNWRIDWWETETSCTITHVDIEVDTTLTLPEWVEPQGVSARVRQEWHRYASALKTHEDGHVAINMGIVQELKVALRDLKPEPTCERLLAKARRISDQLNTEAGIRNRAYDRRTQHGRLEGAVLRMD
ncbi:MAG: DUF922 domain-containing protein [Henriciella sp.]|nr:DUF922 domain-containing protein [Henriciella sp.]